jgi:DNA-binding NarL/FixJ family response regulator
MPGRDGADATSAPRGPKTLVVEPDRAQRRRLERLLARGGFQSLVAETGAQALELARRERPELAVLEVGLADISGYDVCRVLLKRRGPRMGIVFFSEDRTASHDHVAGFLIGADDYIDKPISDDELLARLTAVARRTASSLQPLAPVIEAGLTPREEEVLHLMADGLSQQEIAAQLVLSPRTVGKHIEHILGKLRARSRAEAVAIAYKSGFHPIPPPFASDL